MERMEKLYEGKAKILYTTADPGLVIQYFKDDASAFNGVKKGTIIDKGVMNNHVSSRTAHGSSVPLASKAEFIPAFDASWYLQCCS